MRCLLLYDIPSDKIRKKISDACLDYGLDRTQYSVFTGNISRNLQGELFLKVTDLLGDEDGHIMLIPICQKDWRTKSMGGDTSCVIIGGGWGVASGGWRVADGGWRMADGGYVLATRILATRILATRILATRTLATHKTLWMNLYFV